MSLQFNSEAEKELIYKLHISVLQIALLFVLAFESPPLRCAALLPSRPTHKLHIFAFDIPPLTTTTDPESVL